MSVERPRRHEENLQTPPEADLQLGTCWLACGFTARRLEELRCLILNLRVSPTNTASLLMAARCKADRVVGDNLAVFGTHLECFARVGRHMFSGEGRRKSLGRGGKTLK